jgi:hypothetical protein
VFATQRAQDCEGHIPGMSPNSLSRVAVVSCVFSSIIVCASGAKHNGVSVGRGGCCFDPECDVTLQSLMLRTADSDEILCTPGGASADAVGAVHVGASGRQLVSTNVSSESVDWRSASSPRRKASTHRSIVSISIVCTRAIRRFETERGMNVSRCRRYFLSVRVDCSGRSGTQQQFPIAEYPFFRQENHATKHNNFLVDGFISFPTYGVTTVFCLDKLTEAHQKRQEWISVLEQQTDMALLNIGHSITDLGGSGVNWG